MARKLEEPKEIMSRRPKKRVPKRRDWLVLCNAADSSQGKAEHVSHTSSSC